MKWRALAAELDGSCATSAREREELPRSAGAPHADRPLARAARGASKATVTLVAVELELIKRAHEPLDVVVADEADSAAVRGYVFAAAPLDESIAVDCDAVGRAHAKARRSLEGHRHVRRTFQTTMSEGAAADEQSKDCDTHERRTRPEVACCSSQGSLRRLRRRESKRDLPFTYTASTSLIQHTNVSPPGSGPWAAAP